MLKRYNLQIDIENTFNILDKSEVDMIVMQYKVCIDYFIKTNLEKDIQHIEKIHYDIENEFISKYLDKTYSLKKYISFLKKYKKQILFFCSIYYLI